MLESFVQNTILPNFINIGGTTNTECSECGKRVPLETNGDTFRVVSACKCPTEDIIEFELNVPSGEMIFTDDLRPLFNTLGDFDINCKLGTIKRTQAMARIGCAHGFVGNSCPSIFRTGENSFIIANVPIDEETDEPISTLGEKVGCIITDLWWYSFADAEEFERRGGKKTDNVNRLSVLPGVYKFSHNLRAYDGDPEIVRYATFEWVREPEEPRDYLKEFREMNFTAGQVIAHMIKQWPALYSEPDAIMSAADHMFCVIGGGGDWHPNGFVQYDPDIPKDAPDLEIPVFDKPYQWYPLCEYSTVVVAAGLSNREERLPLNSSFVALARNILECMIKHGSIPYSHFAEKGDTNLEIAKMCLERINELYPV